MVQHFKQDRKRKEVSITYRVFKQTNVSCCGKEKTVLCGCFSFNINSFNKFIFGVLEEDGQFLQGHMSGPKRFKKTNSVYIPTTYFVLVNDLQGARNTCTIQYSAPDLNSRFIKLMTISVSKAQMGKGQENWVWTFSGVCFTFTTTE